MIKANLLSPGVCPSHKILWEHFQIFLHERLLLHMQASYVELVTQLVEIHFCVVIGQQVINIRFTTKSTGSWMHDSVILASGNIVQGHWQPPSLKNAISQKCSTFLVMLHISDTRSAVAVQRSLNSNLDQRCRLVLGR